MRQDWLQPNQAAGGFGIAQSINHTRKTQVPLVNLRGPGPSLWMLQPNNQPWTKLVTNTFPSRTIVTLRCWTWTVFTSIRQLHWSAVQAWADFEIREKWEAHIPASSVQFTYTNFCQGDLSQKLHNQQPPPPPPRQPYPLPPHPPPQKIK